MKIILIFCLIIGVSIKVYAGSTFFSESIIVEDTEIGISSTAKEPDLKKAYFYVSGGGIRFWIDGTTPTSVYGLVLFVDESMVISGLNNLLNFKCVRAGSNTTTLMVTYER